MTKNIIPVVPQTINNVYKRSPLSVVRRSTSEASCCLTLLWAYRGKQYITTIGLSVIPARRTAGGGERTTVKGYQRITYITENRPWPNNGGRIFRPDFP